MPMTAESAGEYVLSDIAADHSAAKENPTPSEALTQQKPAGYIDDVMARSEFKDARELFR